MYVYMLNQIMYVKFLRNILQCVHSRYNTILLSIGNTWYRHSHLVHLFYLNSVILPVLSVAHVIMQGSSEISQSKTRFAAERQGRELLLVDDAQLDVGSVQADRLQVDHEAIDQDARLVEG